MDQQECKSCKGARLKKESLHFKIDEKTIAEVAQMDLNELYQWILDLPGKLSANELKIGRKSSKKLRHEQSFYSM